MTYTYEQYCDDVESGKVVTCRFVKQAVQRFRHMCADPRYEFRPQSAQRVIDFFALLKHFTGKHSGKSFELMPWQQFCLAAIYGFYHAGTARRVVTSVYMEMARKQGKTALSAGLSLFHLVGDGEAGAEVYLAANSRDQAKIAYKYTQAFADNLDRKHQLLQTYRDNITFNKTHSTLKVLAADASKLDGPNPSMFLLDEFHAARDTSLKDVLQSGQGMRENPMQIIITTAGFDKLGPCFELRTTCTEILAGIKEDDSQFAIIYTLDDDDDWKNPDVWAKSNPNLGVTVRPEYLQEQVTRASNTPSEETGIKTKNLNIWCDAQTVWIPEHYVLAGVHHKSMEEFRNWDAWAGVDLSSTSDLTAISFMVPTHGAIYWWNRYYLPEASLQEHRFKQLYGKWRTEGALIVTPGNVVDYDWILNDIRDVGKILNIQGVAYDSWNATQFVINATDAGLPMEPFSQTLGSFNRPTKEFERLMLSGQAFIDSNIINRHCIRNVTLARDRNGNTKPTKEHVEKKIDGIIPILESLGLWLNCPRFGEFV